MLNFKKIELNDYEIYNKYLNKTKELSCECSFVNMLVWQSVYNNMLAVCDDLLLFKSNDGEIETFSLPFGNDLEKGMSLLLEYNGGKPMNIWAQEGPRFHKFYELFSEKYTISESRDCFDYIYLRSDLAELKGKKYHSKRNHISSFSKKHNWHYKKITSDNISDIKLCAKKWYKENTERFDRSLEAEKQGVLTMLDNMDYLNLLGGAIYVENNVVAFTLGSPIGNDVFDIHIEKALKDYSEAYTVINREFAKNELLDYKYINREDDLGLEGLRKSKLSYKPAILLKKYYCEPIENEL